MAKQDKSIRWNVTMCMILVAYLAWGFLAGSYAGNSGGAVAPVVGRRTSGIIMLIMGMYSFIATSIVQLPNFFRSLCGICKTASGCRFCLLCSNAESSLADTGWRSWRIILPGRRYSPAERRKGNDQPVNCWQLFWDCSC